MQVQSFPFFCCTKIKSVLFQPEEKKATHRPMKVQVGFHLRGLVNSKRTVKLGFQGVLRL